MTKAQNKAKWLRIGLLTAAVVCWGLWLLWMLAVVLEMKIPGTDIVIAGMWATPLRFLAFTEDTWLYVVNVLLVLAILLSTQWLFLRRAQSPIATQTSGRPMAPATAAAALIAALLTVGLIATLLELPDWWASIIDASPTAESDFNLWPAWIAILVTWAAWGFVFYRYLKSAQAHTALTRLLRGLIAGSALELIVAAGVHAYAMRDRECYCARGSYTGLILSATALIWCFGPGVLLLFLREKIRRDRTTP